MSATNTPIKLSYSNANTPSTPSQTSPSYLEQPIPLIEIEEGGEHEHFLINSQAISIISSIQKPICVVAIAGLYRTGKSALLNWLLGRKAGFTVGPTINRCTRGIWLWGTPMDGKLASGEDCAILMLDTEGLGGIEADNKYDARIFSLAILLCSTLIYNSLGSIDEQAISNLSFITQIASHIKLSSSSSSSSDSSNSNQQDSNSNLDVFNFHKIFPTFVWVVRDFTLELVDPEGYEISPTQYLNMSLETTGHFDKQSIERDRIRNMISSFFVDRKCVTLVRPVSDEEALQQVDSLPFETLRADFKKSIDILKKTIFEGIKPKMIEGKALNGAMFAGLVSSYVNAINAGGVPTISTAWEDISRQECARAKDAALDTYKSELASQYAMERLPLESSEMSRIYHEASSESISSFKNRAVGANVQVELDSLVEEMKKLYTQYENVNLEVSSKQCTNVLGQLFEHPIRQKLSKTIPETGMNYYSHHLSEFKNDWNELYVLYMQSARGPSALKTFNDFVRVKTIECSEFIIRNMKLKYEDDVTSLKSDINNLSMSLSRERTEVQLLRDTLQNLEISTRRTDSENRDLVARCQAQAAQIEELTILKRQAERAIDEEKDYRRRCEEKNFVLSKKVEDLLNKEHEVFELRIARERQELQIEALEEEVKEMQIQCDQIKHKKCIIS